ncbi:hypothetical protein PPERSA_01642 [Pseudocohnilembus persalinus]|uniref:Uncharacterized protein n=1 Tax=Pseudocohnilembus persalinus TaxID=266149 RepID=A0A0V0R4N2_PSEPJ|nr:hypothetical protein PPERSA_01642 [Pseudocohnilembus persalinus]|eukprot:KRX09442.1 hypothetical protein PPERSA_01642 [Pseudocohnilembus persalinus]
MNPQQKEDKSQKDIFQRLQDNQQVDLIELIEEKNFNDELSKDNKLILQVDINLNPLYNEILIQYKEKLLQVIINNLGSDNEEVAQNCAQILVEQFNVKTIGCCQHGYNLFNYLKNNKNLKIIMKNLEFQSESRIIIQQCNIQVLNTLLQFLSDCQQEDQTDIDSEFCEKLEQDLDEFLGIIGDDIQNLNNFLKLKNQDSLVGKCFILNILNFAFTQNNYQKLIESIIANDIISTLLRNTLNKDKLNDNNKIDAQEVQKEPKDEIKNNQIDDKNQKLNLQDEIENSIEKIQRNESIENDGVLFPKINKVMSLEEEDYEKQMNDQSQIEKNECQNIFNQNQQNQNKSTKLILNDNKRKQSNFSFGPQSQEDQQDIINYNNQQNKQQSQLNFQNKIDKIEIQQKESNGMSNSYQAINTEDKKYLNQSQQQIQCKKEKEDNYFQQNRENDCKSKLNLFQTDEQQQIQNKKNIYDLESTPINFQDKNGTNDRQDTPINIYHSPKKLKNLPTTSKFRIQKQFIQNNINNEKKPSSEEQQSINSSYENQSSWSNWSNYNQELIHQKLDLLQKRHYLSSKQQSRQSSPDSPDLVSLKSKALSFQSGHFYRYQPNFKSRENILKDETFNGFNNQIKLIYGQSKNRNQNSLKKYNDKSKTFRRNKQSRNFNSLQLSSIAYHSNPELYDDSSSSRSRFKLEPIYNNDDTINEEIQDCEKRGDFQQIDFNCNAGQLNENNIQVNDQNFDNYTSHSDQLYNKKKQQNGIIHSSSSCKKRRVCQKDTLNGESTQQNKQQCFLVIEQDNQDENQNVSKQIILNLFPQKKNKLHKNQQQQMLNQFSENQINSTNKMLIQQQIRQNDKIQKQNSGSYSISGKKDKSNNEIKSKFLQQSENKQFISNNSLDNIEQNQSLGNNLSTQLYHDQNISNMIKYNNKNYNSRSFQLDNNTGQQSKSEQNNLHKIKLNEYNQYQQNNISQKVNIQYMSENSPKLQNNSQDKYQYNTDQQNNQKQDRNQISGQSLNDLNSSNERVTQVESQKQKNFTYNKINKQSDTGIVEEEEDQMAYFLDKNCINLNYGEQDHQQIIQQKQSDDQNFQTDDGYEDEEEEYEKSQSVGFEQRQNDLNDKKNDVKEKNHFQ